VGPASFGKWSFVNIVEIKWDHCYGNNFTGALEKKVQCVILNAIFSKKNNFVRHHLIYMKTRRKQPLPK